VDQAGRQRRTTLTRQSAAIERTNIGGIARRLWLRYSTVEAHVGNIMVKLGPPNDDESHRRVQAVLTFLDHRDETGSAATQQIENYSTRGALNSP
jgi:hypothetical protein